MITKSYSKGNISAISAYHHPSACAGGLIGMCGNCTITNSYSVGDISAIDIQGNSCTCAGGLVGKCGSCTIINSYSMGNVSATSDTASVAEGGVNGYCNTFSLTNAHWLKYQDTNVNYAVGYSDSLGIPTSIGATAHDSAEDFKTLAEKLNEGLETPVWQNEADKDYPTLIKEEQE